MCDISAFMLLLAAILNDQNTGLISVSFTQSDFDNLAELLACLTSLVADIP